MGLCENCGNHYDKTFTIVTGDVEHVFDSFECAINKIAPRCTHCGTKVLGHGVEAGDKIFCCVHCSRQDGEQDLQDRA